LNIHSKYFKNYLTRIITQVRILHMQCLIIIYLKYVLFTRHILLEYTVQTWVWKRGKGEKERIILENKLLIICINIYIKKYLENPFPISITLAIVKYKTN